MSYSHHPSSRGRTSSQDELWALGQRQGKKMTVYMQLCSSGRRGQVLRVAMRCVLALTCGWSGTVLAAVCVCTEPAVCAPKNRCCSSTSACPQGLLGEQAPLQPALLPNLKRFVLSPLLILLAALGDGLGGAGAAGL